MILIDFTHPGKVPPLKLAKDHRSSLYYLMLDELPAWHPFYYKDWILFRHPEWLVGGSAWVHAYIISQALEKIKEGSNEEHRPVVGSGNPSYDEALGQALKTFGWNPLIAEIINR